jgi:formate hydrogenlyase transcriptional activator
LLRVLQEQEFEHLGSTRTIKVDVRLVAATNRDLARMVADGRFRADLYYRLNVFPLVIPPLRERRDDIPQLVRHFTQHFARRIGRRIEAIPAAIMDALASYSWPGNVRELQNVIERAVILSHGPALQVPLGDLQSAVTRPQNRPPRR